MKTISLYLILCTISFAGSHGRYELSCTSASLRTHLHLSLNDEDFEKTYYPQAIALSVMGNMESMHDDTTMELFKTINHHGVLEIYNTDKTYHFSVDFRKSKTATVTIKEAINPRTGNTIQSLNMTCTKYHDM